MALNRGNLGFTQQIASSTTTAVLTVGSAQTCYIKTILIHSLDESNVQNVSIHCVENSGGSAGTASSTTKIARLGISTGDTFFFEPSYPITLTQNGDSIQVENEGVTPGAINVMVIGDKEV